MCRILLLGSNGQVGHELQRSLAPLGIVTALDYPDVDFTKADALRGLVREHAPNILVNAAAYTAVDKAESEPDKALAINAVAPAVLADEAQKLGAIFVHYSTDYVFDGTKSAPYVESDACCPQSAYGRTKRDGEKAATLCVRHLTFRTSWVYSAHGHNFLKTILHLAAERDTLRIVADQIGAPTTATLLADVPARILEIMTGCGEGEPRWGLYHLVAGGQTSWHGFAQKIVSRALDAGWRLQTTPDRVLPISAAEYPTPASRPANSRLDTAKLRTAFGLQLPDWSVGVDEVLAQLKEARQ